MIYLSGSDFSGKYKVDFTGSNLYLINEATELEKKYLCLFFGLEKYDLLKSETTANNGQIVSQEFIDLFSEKEFAGKLFSLKTALKSLLYYELQMLSRITSFGNGTENLKTDSTNSTFAIFEINTWNEGVDNFNCIQSVTSSAYQNYLKYKSWY